MEVITTSTARVTLPGLLESWRAEPGRPVYIGPYRTPEAVLAPVAVWERMQLLITSQPTAVPASTGKHQLDVISASEARIALFRMLEDWRAEPGSPVLIGRYGTPGAVLVPLAVWQNMLELIADDWDAQTAHLRAARLTDSAGPQAVGLPELATAAGCQELPTPVLQSRGVPRGGASVTAWPAALEDLQRLAMTADTEAAVAALQALCLVLLGKAALTESRCGHGTSYSVADVDGVNVVSVTTRRAARPAGRRGNGGYDTVELVAVDHISW